MSGNINKSKKCWIFWREKFILNKPTIGFNIATEGKFHSFISDNYASVKVVMKYLGRIFIKISEFINIEKWWNIWENCFLYNWQSDAIWKDPRRKDPFQGRWWLLCGIQQGHSHNTNTFLFTVFVNWINDFLTPSSMKFEPAFQILKCINMLELFSFS